MRAVALAGQGFAQRGTAIVDGALSYIDPWVDHLCHGCHHPVQPADAAAVWSKHGIRNGERGGDAGFGWEEGTYFWHLACWLARPKVDERRERWREIEAQPLERKPPT